MDFAAVPDGMARLPAEPQNPQLYEGKKIVKELYVKGKLVNIVAK